MEKCKYINQGDSDIHKCQSNVKYGGYCCKHKREYLVDSNDLIIRDRFTNKMSDYLLKDLIGIIENGYFSSELKFKSERAQESSYNVFERQLQALLNSDDPKHQELVKQYDLANYKNCFRYRNLLYLQFPMYF